MIPHESGSARRWPKIAGAAAVVIAIGIAAGLWLFFRDDAPDDVSLASAIETLEDDGATGDVVDEEPAATADATIEGGTIDGEWVIDTESGEFDYESRPARSSVSESTRSSGRSGRRPPLVAPVTSAAR